MNGKNLEPPIGIWVESVAVLSRDTRCLLRGHGSGKTIGLPHGVARMKNLPLPQASWQFCRTVVVTSVVEPKGLQKK